MTKKNRQISINLPKNDFTRKIKDFDIFTKIACECGRFGQVNRPIWSHYWKLLNCCMIEALHQNGFPLFVIWAIMGTGSFRLLRFCCDQCLGQFVVIHFYNYLQHIALVTGHSRFAVVCTGLKPSQSLTSLRVAFPRGQDF